ncbi:MAG: dephospho-CoA kinase [bacterium]
MKKAKNRVVALTGGIATGKSVVSKHLSTHHGFTVINADIVGHEVLQEPDVAEKIRLSFGEDTIENKEINRKKLGKIVFSDPSKLSLLNSIVHPLLIAKALEKILSTPPEAKIVFEAAVLIEAGWHKHFNKVIVTTCSPEIQLKRVMERDKLSKEEALKIISSQIPQSERAQFADYIVDTSKGLQSVTAKLDEIVNQLKIEGF